MRAICEACARPQPPDWSAADFCVHCGRPVRPELRCFWCVKWTPANGKYCRSCGAEVVKPALFGAARMLKDAGVDRFGVPQMLVDLDPEQIENFIQIYNRHAAALARHVDHMRALEPFLHRKDWSDAVETELIVQLPWSEERLEAFSPPHDPAERASIGTMTQPEILALAQYLAQRSPVSLTRALASVVRVRLEDWEAVKDAKSVLYSRDPQVRGEAALALTNWRMVYGPGIHDDRYQFRDALRDCPFRLEAAVNLALIGSSEDVLPAGAAESEDPDIVFTAALVSGDIDRLVAAEKEPDRMKQYTAAWRLLRMGCFAGVGEVIRNATPKRQRDLLGVITWQKRPPHELRELLFELLETSADQTVRRDASCALALAHHTGDTMRIARAAQGEHDIYQSLLQTTDATPEELADFCEFLLERGELSARQWGISDIAKKDRLPADFVPRHWAGAGESARVELCQIAEMQLEAHADEELHRFLVNVVFGDEAFAVQEQAWTCLYRWYERSDQGRMGPLLIQAEALRRFFGSASSFVPILTRFLGAGTPRRFVRETSSRQRLERILIYADASVLPEWKTVPAEVSNLAEALAGIVRDAVCDLMIRVGAIRLMALVAGVPEARNRVIEILKSSRREELNIHLTDALEQIARAC